MSILVLATAALVMKGAPAYAPSGPQIQVTLSGGKSFVITTDPKVAPKTVKAIIALVKSGYYNGQMFHRVEDWVIQWGDPQSKTLQLGDPRLGSGGTGHPLPFEGSSVKFERGVVGVASTGSRVGGDSQLFVLTKDARYLDRDYAVLGKVTSGMNVVDHIQLGERISKISLISARKK